MFSTASHRALRGTAAIATALGVLGGLAGCGTQSSPATSTTSSPVTSSVVPSTASSSVDQHLASSNPPVYSGSVSGAPSSTASVAQKFVQILSHTAGVDRAHWTKQLMPLCSQSFGDQLALDSPSQIPDQAVTGPAQLVQNSPLLEAAYFVPTTKGGFTVWMDYNTAPGVVTGALPGRHSFEEGQQ